MTSRRDAPGRRCPARRPRAPVARPTPLAPWPCVWHRPQSAPATAGHSPPPPAPLRAGLSARPPSAGRTVPPVPFVTPASTLQPCAGLAGLALEWRSAFSSLGRHRDLDPAPAHPRPARLLQIELYGQPAPAGLIRRVRRTSSTAVLRVHPGRPGFFTARGRITPDLLRCQTGAGGA